MGLRSDLDVRRLAAPLLALLLLGASATVPASETEARRAARTLLDRGDLKGAQTLIDAALARFSARNTEAVWALRVMRAEALYGMADRDGARKALAFELPAQLRTSETAVRQLILRMYVEGNAAHAEKARAIAEKHALSALSDVYVAMIALPANAPRREELAREAIRVANKHGNKSAQAKALAGLAFALAGSQHFAESVQWGEQALALARSAGLVKYAQQIEGNLGWSYLALGDNETAAELFTQAEATARRIDAKAERIPWLIQLGNIRSAARDWAGAERHNQEAVAVVRQIGGHDQLAYALANLARVAIETGRFADARRLNNESLQHRQQDREGQLRSHILEARILTAEGKFDAAAKLLNEVSRETTRAMTRAEAAGQLAAMYVRMNRAKPAEEQFERAIAAAREAGAEVESIDLRLSLANTSAEIFGAYVELLARSGRAEDALALTEKHRAQTLEEGLTVPAKLDARAVARQNDATILCYWLGRDRSYLWMVTKNDVVQHALPPGTTIEAAAETYRRELLGPRGSMQWSGARGLELYRMLIQPAAASIAKSSRVIVVADGKLHALNFETLVAPSPQRYWIEDVVVMNASSLQLLARTARKRAASPALLLVGNTPSPDPEYPALPHAAGEMRAIEKRFPRRTVLEGAKATPAAYQSASPEKFDYLHFVAHGVATRKRPLDSAVILARDASSRYKLLARDVMQQPINAQLVTISSCHGAGSRTYAGEGVVGLAWAFLRAGADQVVAALWQVKDAATPQLMDRMYAGIRAGKDPAVALREAKLQFVKGTGAYRNPRYWAPFVLYAGT